MVKPLGLGEALGLLLEVKRRAGRRERYVASLESYLGGFVRELGAGYPVKAIRAAQIEAFIFRNSPAASSAASNAGRFSSLFGLLVRRGVLRASPMAGLDRITVEPSIPRCYSAKDCAAILGAALKSKAGRRGLGALALGFFLGIRPEEISRIGWDAVRADGVLVAHTKTRDRRRVPMNETARAWLAWGLEHGAQLPPHGNLKRTLAAIRKRAGVESIQDGARKTCASMMYAAGASPESIARALGNSTRILWAAYVDTVGISADEAREFWALRPVEDKQLQFNFGK